MTFQDVMTQVSKFNSQEMAIHYQFRKPGRWIVLGDNGQYWVTTYRYARWLETQGYEILN